MPHVKCHQPRPAANPEGELSATTIGPLAHPRCQLKDFTQSANAFTTSALPSPCSKAYRCTSPPSAFSGWIQRLQRRQAALYPRYAALPQRLGPRRNRLSLFGLLQMSAHLELCMRRTAQDPQKPLGSRRISKSSSRPLITSRSSHRERGRCCPRCLVPCLRPSACQARAASCTCQAAFPIVNPSRICPQVSPTFVSLLNIT